MKALLFYLMAVSVNGAEIDWKPLDSCVQRLKLFGQSYESSPAMRQVASLDRRLHFLIDGIKRTEYNSNRLKEVLQSEQGDKLKPYLVSNAAVACEAFESTLTTYYSGLKMFLLFFFFTTIAIAAYGAYLVSILNRRA